jgi:hypothetical protein
MKLTSLSAVAGGYIDSQLLIHSETFNVLFYWQGHTCLKNAKRLFAFPKATLLNILPFRCKVIQTRWLLQYVCYGHQSQHAAILSCTCVAACCCAVYLCVRVIFRIGVDFVTGQ